LYNELKHVLNGDSEKNHNAFFLNANAKKHISNLFTVTKSTTHNCPAGFGSKTIPTPQDMFDHRERGGGVNIF
jgi:hypothetical protein